MISEKFAAAVDRILAKDSRYKKEAYLFVNEAVAYTVRKHLNAETGSSRTRHVSGPELVSGAAEMAVREYGPLALAVLREWGVTGGSAVGDIVFSLIEQGVLTASPSDRREDFDIYPDIGILLELDFPAPKGKTSPVPPVIA